MLPRSGISKIAPVLFINTLLSLPAAAHKVETAQDVGGTFHIEPDDAPQAGKPELAWFALTQKGGKLIPLEQCNCKLAVRVEPHTESSPPLLEPPLKAISIERYKSIPSAEIVFPLVGAYKLELSGTPKAGATFKPFQVDYEVTVAPGVAAAAPTTSPQTVQLPNQTANQPTAQWRVPAIALGTIIGLGIVGVVWRKLK